MPLRALIDGSDVVAPLLDRDGWETLRANVRARRGELILPCCGVSAFPRVSKLGTRHFVHRRADGCPGSGETFQHLWLKAEILRACATAGWQAQPEVAGEGWRADVLATRGEGRVAFEVQWSPQADETFRLRQERYAAAGIRSCWLYRGDVPRPARHELPIFSLEPDEAQVAVIVVGGCRYGAAEFVGRLLGGGVRFTTSLTRWLRISFIDFPCWRCDRPAHIYYTGQRSRCGHATGFAFRDGETVDEFNPRVLAHVQDWLAREGRRAGIQLGAVKRRWSNTLQESYSSFGCPHCDALFGEHFVRSAVHEALTYESADASFEVEYAAIGEQGHWCLPTEGVPFCGEEVVQRAA